MYDFSNTDFGLRVAWAYYSLPRENGEPPTKSRVELEAGFKSPNELRKIIIGKRSQKRMSSDRLRGLSRALGVSEQWLAHGTGRAPRPTGHLEPRKVAGRPPPPKGWRVWLSPEEWYAYETTAPLESDEPSDAASDALAVISSRKEFAHIASDLEELVDIQQDQHGSQCKTWSQEKWERFLVSSADLLSRVASRAKPSSRPPRPTEEERMPLIPKRSGTVTISGKSSAPPGIKNRVG